MSIINDRRPYRDIAKQYVKPFPWQLTPANPCTKPVTAVGLAGTVTPADAQTKTAAEKLDPTERAWVKIPGMHPDMVNALRPLTVEECDRLIDRAQQAKLRIEKARNEAAQALLPGDRVRTAAGSTGTIISVVGPFYVNVLWDRKQPNFLGQRTLAGTTTTTTKKSLAKL